ncbi:putative membrane protein [Rubellimicrobium thermophilum DSM 16684]|uniref:Putative membrane protein n=1 Tax=Rubellimicrobium thermophilum DSM 16684 TaxID=1123069 RepID=S9S6Y2_9RHOB|nr:DUF805 domain-containing protein [Rubellimicrobium thermophilum]EPX85955.1 putative membrane protein [Rubellimicrobium thermophilum DSM 16684]
MAGWYYAQGQEQKGPVDEGALRALAEAGVVTPDTLVWREGMADWEPARAHLAALGAGDPPLMPGRTVPAGGGGYSEQVGMAEAFRRFWRNFANFSGRANRGEFWWAVLAVMLIGMAVSALDVALFGTGEEAPAVLSGLWSLATLIPSLSLGARRLHDIDRSGWWQLLGLIPLVGLIILIVWWARKPDPRPNRFG